MQWRGKNTEQPASTLMIDADIPLPSGREHPPDADIFEINTPDPFPCNDRSPATSRGLNFSAYPYPPADPALARQTKTAVCVLAKSSGESNAREWWVSVHVFRGLSA